MFSGSTASMSAGYYVASLKHTQNHHEHIVWWGPNWTGYTPVVGPNIGTYDAETAAKLNDGLDCIAVPVDAVKALLSPEPYFKPGARFYDQAGPVVNNARAVWDALLAARLAAGRNPQTKPKPAPFRGRRRTWTA